MVRVVLLQFSLFLSLSAHATDYYFSALGNDSNSGTSSSSPWRSLNKANNISFRAGDRLFLKGGDIFAGPLNFTSNDVGSPTNPILVTSYGSGKALISVASGNGIYAYNTAGIKITNLKLIGSNTNPSSGIYFFNYLSGDIKLDTIIINGVEASGFYDAGIQIGGWNGSSGFRNVSIINSRVYNNRKNGLHIWGYSANKYPGLAHKNVLIRNVYAYNNTGVSGQSSPTGSGIVMSSVDGGVIERCVAFGNGKLNTSSTGPVGIWAWQSNNIRIQHNESYNNRTGSGGKDGGGFDLDGAVTNSVMQYNYSHGNDGPGYLIAQFANSPKTHANNIIRYNVSENDGRKNNYGAIVVWASSSATYGISNLHIYNNTVYSTPSSSGVPRGLAVYSPTQGLKIRNNIFVTTGGLNLLDIVSNQQGLEIQGNTYWSSGSAFRIVMGSTLYGSLSGFRTATGHERIGSTPTGFQTNPKLTAPGRGVTFGNAYRLKELSGYKLSETSPLRDKGLNLSQLFGVSPGAFDFFGSALPVNGLYDVGAHEYSSGSVSTVDP